MSFSVTGKGGSEPGCYVRGLRPPILKFSFQVGDVRFCGFYPVLPLNGVFWRKGICPWGLCSITDPPATWLYTNLFRLIPSHHRPRPTIALPSRTQNCWTVFCFSLLFFILLVDCCWSLRLRAASGVQLALRHLYVLTLLILTLLMFVCWCWTSQSHWYLCKISALWEAYMRLQKVLISPNLPWFRGRGRGRGQN